MTFLHFHLTVFYSGKFFQYLALEKVDIECIAIKSATESSSCDENALAELFGSQSAVDLSNMIKAYNAPAVAAGSDQNEMQNMVEKRITKGSHFQHFLQRIIKCDRDVGRKGDAELAVTQVLL